MAITRESDGTKSAGGTATISVAYSAVAAGRLALTARCIWTSTATGSNEAGWTLTNQAAGGTGASSNDHTTRMRVDQRILDGSESGSVTFDQSTGPNGAMGVMPVFSVASGKTWDIASATGDDATHGTGRAVAAGTNIDFAVGDVLVAFVASDNETNTAFSSPALTASGITFGTTTEVHGAAGGVSTGSNGNIGIYQATVTAGSGTVAPSLALSGGPTQCGPVVFVRLREVDSPGPTRFIDAPNAADFIQTAAGAVAITGARTYAGIFKIDPAATGSRSIFTVAVGSADGDRREGLWYDNSAGKVYLAMPPTTGQSSTFAALSTPEDDWLLYVTSIPNGNGVTPVSQVHNFDTGVTSSPVNGATNVDGWSGTPDRIVFGDAPGGWQLPVTWALFAQFPDDLDQTERESLVSGIAAWEALSPVSLITFRQALNTDPVEDLVGTSDQTAVSGTTVRPSDGPAGFDWGGAPDPAEATAALTLDLELAATAEAPAVMNEAQAAFTLDFALSSEASDPAALLRVWDRVPAIEQVENGAYSFGFAWESDTTIRVPGLWWYAVADGPATVDILLLDETGTTILASGNDVAATGVDEWVLVPFSAAYEADAETEYVAVLQIPGGDYRYDTSGLPQTSVDGHVEVIEGRVEAGAVQLPGTVWSGLHGMALAYELSAGLNEAQAAFTLDLALASVAEAPGFDLDLELPGGGHGIGEGEVTVQTGLDLFRPGGGHGIGAGAVTVETIDVNEAQAAFSLALALASVADAPAVDPNEATAALVLDLALASVADAPAVGIHEAQAAFTLDLALATGALADRTAQAAFGLQLALQTAAGTVPEATAAFGIELALASIAVMPVPGLHQAQAAFSLVLGLDSEAEREYQAQAAFGLQLALAAGPAQADRTAEAALGIVFTLAAEADNGECPGDSYPCPCRPVRRFMEVMSG